MDDDDAFARGIRHGDRVRVCRVTPSGEPEGQGFRPADGRAAREHQVSANLKR
ncbi:MAG: hypothetical protein ACTSU5_19250 [Promethearchaeota archaeon]